jgi:hypothetical protein
MSVEEQEINEIKNRLQILEDREAIRQLIYYKARATDRADAAAEIRAFGSSTPYADRKGPPALMGSAADRAELIKAMLERTHHQIGNIIIDLQGDEARTETYCTAFHRTHPNPESNRFVVGSECIDRLGGDYHRSYDVVTGVRYLETFRKKDGKWTIESRRLVYDWSTAVIAGGLTFNSGVLANSDLRGARRPTDPSYNEYAIGVLDK